MRIDGNTSVPKRVLLDDVEFDIMNMMWADDVSDEIAMIDWSRSSAAPGSRIFHGKDLVNGRVPEIVYRGKVSFDWSEVHLDRGTIIPKPDSDIEAIHRIFSRL